MIKKTLVLGVSINPSRYSYLAVQRLIDNNHKVRALGRIKGEVNGVRIDTTKKMFKNIDTITLYLNKKNQVEYYDYILELKPKRVLFNPGTENEELEKLLIHHNITFEKACTLVLLVTGEY